MTHGYKMRNGQYNRTINSQFAYRRINCGMTGSGGRDYNMVGLLEFIAT